MTVPFSPCYDGYGEVFFRVVKSELFDLGVPAEDLQRVHYRSLRLPLSVEWLFWVTQPDEHAIAREVSVFVRQQQLDRVGTEENLLDLIVTTDVQILTKKGEPTGLMPLRDAIRLVVEVIESCIL